MKKVSVIRVVWIVVGVTIGLLAVLLIGGNFNSGIKALIIIDPDIDFLDDEVSYFEDQCDEELYQCERGILDRLLFCVGPSDPLNDFTSYQLARLCDTNGTISTFTPQQNLCVAIFRLGCRQCEREFAGCIATIPVPTTIGPNIVDDTPSPAPIS